MHYLFFIFSLFTLYAGEILWQEGAISLIEERGLPAICIDSTLEEMSRLEKIAFERAVGKMQNVFEKAFGFGDFTRWMPLNGPRLISYAIPCGAYMQIDEADYEIKTKVMFYTLKNKTELLKPLSSEQMKAIQIAAQEILASNPPIIPLEESSVPLTNTLEGFLLVLNEAGLPSPLLDGETPPFSLKFATKCNVFCNDEILKKQCSAQTTLSHLLYNKGPYVDCHLMAIPKRHITTLSESSDEEILDKFDLFSRVNQIAKKTWPQVAVATRIGWRAGQTQPHLHDHILGFDPEATQPWVLNWVHDFMNKPMPLDPVKWEMNRLFWQESLTDVQ